MWNLPLQTHRCFIEPLGGIPAKTMIYSRFIKFTQSIRESGKAVPFYLLEKIRRNKNTITGKHLRHVAIQVNNFNILDDNIDKMKMKFKLC